MSDEINWDELTAPIPAEYVKTVDKGYGPRSYVDAPALMERLDHVLGPDGWMESTIIEWHGDYPTANCRLSINVNDAWLGKTGIGGPNNVGRGTSDSGRVDKDGNPRKDGPLHVEDDEPAKCAASDAFRRACRKWGIGRELWLQSAAHKGTQASQEGRSGTPEGGDTTKGNCPVHNVPFRHNVGTSRTGKAYDFWSCPVREDNGKWCDQKPPRADPEQQSLAESEPPAEPGAEKPEALAQLWSECNKQLRFLGCVKRSDVAGIVSKWAEKSDFPNARRAEDVKDPTAALALLTHLKAQVDAFEEQEGGVTDE